MNKQAKAAPAKPANGEVKKPQGFRYVLMGLEGKEYVKEERVADSWESLLVALKPFGPAFRKGLKEVIIVTK